MSKNKLTKFADLLTFPNVFQAPSCLTELPPELSAGWASRYFGNDHPITLELGCGRGEYTVELAARYPDRNFIGVDIKGARLWTGAKEALNRKLTNAAFLRTEIAGIDRLFAADEVAELWLTFSDPQMKKPAKRLTSPAFLARYRRFLVDGGNIHLKTDSMFLYQYTLAVATANALPVVCAFDDIEGCADADLLDIHTCYEEQWRGRGIPIKYIRLRLPAEGALVEPDVEIALDNYRSYNRHKRSSLDAAH